MAPYLPHMKASALIVSLLFIFQSLGQTTTYEVNGNQFMARTSIVENEWGTKDTINKFYRIEDGQTIFLLDFYVFKDGGGDCNNLFWEREYIQFDEDKIIFRTAYFQKTNMDPIPTERKQIYSVNAAGQLTLIFDKYRYRNDKTWVDL
ncbi:MAG: hypothetical protein ABJG68_02615 [Crocinitomicaceae bacterium]